MSANLIEMIRDYILQAGRGLTGKHNPQKSQDPTKPGIEDSQRLQDILDGMGTGTARIIIDREAGRRISEDFDLKGLENKGRYYLARVVRPDGSLIDELLVDKQNGRVQFTRDHTFVQEMIDEGELTPESAAHHPLRKMLTCALGTQEPLEKVDTAVVDAAAGDHFLLCSDGLHNMISSETIAAGQTVRDSGFQGAG